MRRCLILLVASLCVLASQAATIEFAATNYDFSGTDPVTFDWSSSSTWTATVPGSADDVVIGRCGYVDATLCNFDYDSGQVPSVVINIGSSTVTIRSLRFAATNVEISGTAGARLIITGSLTWNAGFFNVPVEVRGASQSLDVLVNNNIERVHGLRGSGSLFVASNTFTMSATRFKLLGSSSITIGSSGTLRFVPPYDRSPVSTANVDYGANDRFASPYPTIYNYGTLSFAPVLRVDFPLDSCTLFASIVSNGTISASGPSCIIRQPYVDATTNPAATSSLDGPFSFTGTGNVWFIGGSILLGSRLNTGTASATNYVKFGEKDDVDILDEASSNGLGWTYLRTNAAVLINHHFWIDGTTYVAGPNKLTFSRLTFSAGALHAPIDVSTAFTMLNNLAAGGRPIGYLASTLTLTSGSGHLFDRTPEQYQEPQNIKTFIMRPNSAIVINSGATATVNFVPLHNDPTLTTGAAPQVINSGTLVFRQPAFPSDWNVFVDNRGTISTAGSPRGNYLTDYAARLLVGGVNSGTFNFPGQVGVSLAGAWAQSATAQFTGSSSAVGFLTWAPKENIAVADQTMSFLGNADIFSLEIAAPQGRFESSPSGVARSITVRNLLARDSFTLCCSGTSYTFPNNAFFGTELYRMILEDAKVIITGTFNIQGPYIKASTTGSSIVNRGTFNVVSEGGVIPEDGMPMHFINEAAVTVKGGQATFAGLVSKSSIEFLTTADATTGAGFSSPTSILYWRMALILNVTNTLTMNIYQRPVGFAYNDQIMYGSEVIDGRGFVAYGQYCYLDGALRLQFKTVRTDTWTPVVGDAYQLLFWHPDRACDGTFTSLIATGLPTGLGVQIQYTNPADSADGGVFAVVCSTSTAGCNTIGQRPAGPRGTLDPRVVPYLMGNVPATAVIQAPPPTTAAPIAAPVAAPTRPGAPTGGNTPVPTPPSGSSSSPSTGSSSSPSSGSSSAPSSGSSSPVPNGSPAAEGAPSNRIVSSSSITQASMLVAAIVALIAVAWL